MKNRGVSLIVLVITIIVISVLAGTIILLLFNNNTLDQSKKAKFMSDYRTVQEGVNLFSLGKYNADTNEFELPLRGYLTAEDKTYIADKVPTLKTKIEELSGTLDTVNLAWISSEDIGIKLSNEKAEKGYIMDVATGLIYDYNGDYFEGLRWHTLDAGVGDIKTEHGSEIWDGWIKLTLFYPSSSTERMWRLSSEGETRTDTSLAWENYTGPITIPLSRVEDVWIKYKIDGKKVIIPPSGVALVDIQPDTTAKDVTSVKINITYDNDATIKEYKVGDGGWKTYTGEFTVTENCLIEARVVKPDNVYDSTGKLVTRRNAENSDAYYVGNIKKPGPTVDDTLEPPTLTRLGPTISGEIAKVRVTYPANAVTKLYTIDYGVEQNYTEDISIEEYGTYVIAYYYTLDGKKSPAVRILIDETGSGPTYDDLSAPTINNLGQTKTDEVTALSVTYPAKAVKKVYSINGGAEISYTGNISITEYRTYVKAYYYDASGRRSDYDWIYIKAPGSTGRPGYPPPPTYETPIEPKIILNPSTVTTSTQVSVVAPAEADRIYISVGNGAYKLYSSPITLSNNTTVRSYYITYSGKRSYTAYKRVNIIRTEGPTGLTMPYVGIDVTPYTSSLINKVSVSLLYADADNVEYSFDGIIYKAYAGTFDVTENCTIYARATNANGTSTDTESITNIGTKPPKPKTTLGVNISATPEPSAITTLVDKVKISIEYDAEATDKYYSIGVSGILVPYTGEFEVTKNCTIYAYAVSATARGTDIKIIDNIVDGISDPLITSNPNNSIVSSKDKITISYDKNATLKQYKINGGTLRDYTGAFEVTENCTIYAYSKNAKGQTSNASYAVTNIPAPPKVITIDYGKYFLLKLNYPMGSSTKEYKWKENGTWKSYKTAGILLIKPEYKDEFIDATGAIIVKIKDENGIESTFTGDYYLLDVGLSEINENIFMRWDRISPNVPEIVPDTLEPTKEVNVTINYEDYLVKKQYKIVDKDGNIVTDWTDYKGPLRITDNKTTVYAKGQDDAEVWSAESNKKITNIDELPPEIKLTLDATTAVQTLPVRVSVTDDVAVGKVKWVAGTQGEGYFISGGTEISNNSVVKITENGYYTFYAEDKAENTQIYTLNVTNIDVTAPKIDIQVSPETTLGLTADITINYGDSITKQYKVGTNNAVWTNYTTTFGISSYTVLANNWQNADGTVTIYAKGKDTAGNEITVERKVVSLDLDKPKTPVITSNSGYPILTSYGVKFDSVTTILYDTRTDIDNYYSVDNGTTWINYTGQFDFQAGTILAKSVKKDSRLEVSISKTVTMPSNAIGTAAYDGNNSTYYETWNTTEKYMSIDSSMQGQKARIYIYTAGTNSSLSGNDYVKFYDSQGALVGSIPIYLWKTTYDSIVTIPSTAVKLSIYAYSSQCYMRLYEIEPSNEPTFTATNGYMLLHADSTKSIKKPYQLVTINYSSTSVGRLYSIDGGTTWKNYSDNAVWVDQGVTLYAKGIDRSGNESRIVSSYTANVTDALKQEAFDANESTYSYFYSPNKVGTILFDPSLYGRKIRLHTYSINPYGNGGYYVYANFADKNGNILSTVNLGSSNQTYNSSTVIPQNTYKLYFTNSGNNESVNVYEIEVMNEPTFTISNGYMLLHSDPTKSINIPYQLVSIDYFPTSIQKLYSLDGGTNWFNYENKAIWLNQGSAIYAKGIDQYGNQTRIISTYTSNVPDAITTPAYDGSYSTYYETWNTTQKYMSIDSSMQGKKARIYIYTAGTNNSLSGYDYVKFYDAQGTLVGSIPIYLWKTTYDNIVTIPSTAVKLSIYAYSSQCYIRLYEVQPQ